MCARSTACCATARAPRPTGFTLTGDGLFQRLELDRPGRAARHRSGHHRPLRHARSDRWRHRPAASACPAIGRIRASTGRARSAPMSCAPTCSSSTTSPISSTIPSMATSSTSSIAAPSGGFDARHAFDWRFGGFETQTRVGLQTPLRRHPCRPVQDRAARAAFDRARGPRAGRQCRLLDRHDHALDRLAAHHRRHPRGHFAGRVLSDTPENSGNAQASMTSPKAGIVLGPWYKTEFYGNAGYGLHSNDIRGATITVDPDRQGDAAGSRAAAGSVEGRRARHPHQGDRRPHQLGRGVRARFRFRTAVRRRRRHHRGRAGRAAASAWSGPTSTSLCRG